MMTKNRNILIISIPEDTPRFEALLSDGRQFGIKLSYAVQEKSDGLAQAFIIAEKFIGNDAYAMVLGDNIFYGNVLENMLKSIAKRAKIGKASVFGFYIHNLECFDVVEFDKSFKALSIEEKLSMSKSNHAVTGLYFYLPGVNEMNMLIKPSVPSELEIITLKQMYLGKELLDYDIMERGFSWLDT